MGNQRRYRREFRGYSLTYIGIVNEPCYNKLCVSNFVQMKPYQIH